MFNSFGWVMPAVRELQRRATLLEADTLASGALPGEFNVSFQWCVGRDTPGFRLVPVLR